MDLEHEQRSAEIAAPRRDDSRSKSKSRSRSLSQSPPRSPPPSESDEGEGLSSQQHKRRRLDYDSDRDAKHDSETETASAEMHRFEQRMAAQAQAQAQAQRPAVSRIPATSMPANFLRLRLTQRQQQQRQEQKRQQQQQPREEVEANAVAADAADAADDEAYEVSEEQAEAEEGEAEEGFYDAYPHLRPKAKPKAKAKSKAKAKAKGKGKSKRKSMPLQRAIDLASEWLRVGNAAANSNSPEEANAMLGGDGGAGSGGGGGGGMSLPPMGADDGLPGMGDIPLHPKHIATRRIDFDEWDEEDKKRCAAEDPVALREEWVAMAHDDVKAYECDPTWCFWCLCTERVIDTTGEESNMQSIVDYLQENWHKVNKRVLMREAQKRYNTKLRWFLTDPVMQKPWMMSTIYRHFTEHDQSGIFQMEEDLGNLNEALAVQGGSRLLLEDTTTREKSVDAGGVKLFMQMLNAKLRLLASMRGFRANNTV